MNKRALRHLLIALLTLAGIFQLLVAMMGGAPGFGYILAGSGFVFIMIGFFARADTRDGSKSRSRNAVLAGAAAAAANLVLCFYIYRQPADTASLFVIAAGDLAILAAAMMWLAKPGARKRR